MGGGRYDAPLLVRRWYRASYGTTAEGVEGGPLPILQATSQFCSYDRLHDGNLRLLLLESDAVGDQPRRDLLQAGVRLK